MKKLMLVIASLFLLAGCGPVFSQKQNLTDHTTTVKQAITTETKALTAIDSAFNAFPSTFQAAYAAAPKADFQTVASLTKLTDQAKKAYRQFDQAQGQLAASQTALSKLANQGTNTLPTAKLQAVSTSLRLTKLDNRTYATYYKELTTALTEFYRDVAADHSAKAVDAALTRFNQYIASLSQQTDILSANLSTVKDDNQALRKAVRTMKD